MNKLKKELIGWFLGFCLVFAGFIITACTDQNQSQTQSQSQSVTTDNINRVMPTIIQQSNGDDPIHDPIHDNTPVEICYKNIQYVFFPNGYASWGSPMYDSGTGHIIVCR